MNAQYFIEKFKNIPEENWHVNQFVNEDNPKQMCALGHLGERLGSPSDEAFHLIKLFNWSFNNRAVRDVNDGTFGCDQYGKNPKERILKVLSIIQGGN